MLAPIQTLHLQLLARRLGECDEAFERAMRPVLLPNEAWADLASWRSNVRLLAWLRSESLVRSPETRRLLPAAEATLQPAERQVPPLLPAAEATLPAAEATLQPAERPLPPLPDAATVRRLFERSRPDGVGGTPRRAAHGSAPLPDGSTRGAPFVEVLHRAGGLLRGRGALNAYCERHGMYEVLTAEMIGALAAHVRARLPALRERSAADGVGGVVVLEVGAGTGALAHFLARELEAEPQLAVVACDSRAQALPGARYPGVVEMSASAALAAFAPQLVLCSWMPMGRDLSAAFRQCAAVEEYVLLGEADDGACGHNWHTWGNPDFRPGGAAGGEGGEGTPTPPYVADGFRRIELDDVSRWMASRYDGDGDEGCNSCAVSFVRGGGGGGGGGGGDFG